MFPCSFIQSPSRVVVSYSHHTPCDENTTWWRSTFRANYRGKWEWPVVQEIEFHYLPIGGVLYSTYRSRIFEECDMLRQCLKILSPVGGVARHAVQTTGCIFYFTFIGLLLLAFFLSRIQGPISYMVRFFSSDILMRAFKGGPSDFRTKILQKY